MIWRIGLLFLGALVLIGASVAIVGGALRGTSGGSASAVPIATYSAIPSSAIITVTSAPASATSAAPPTRPPATPALATRTVALATPQATAPRATGTIVPLPTVANGGCAMSLPAGYEADPTQIGYFPALERTGFVALDSFAVGDQTPMTLAETFANGTLSRVLTDYQQTGATDLGDRYRIDYRATSGGKTGRGSTQVQVFGGIGCGVTVFAFDNATGPLAATFDLLVRSLRPVQAPRTATP